MATASHSHMPDLSASLNDSHSCAPLSDLWNLPQSKLFPGVHAPAPSANNGPGGPAPSAASSQGRPVPASAPVSSAPSGATTPTSHGPYGSASLWNRAPATMSPSPVGSSGNALAAQPSLLAPSSSPTYRAPPQPALTQGRGIWGQDYGFRPSVVSPFGPGSNAATPGRAVSNTNTVGSSVGSGVTNGVTTWNGLDSKRGFLGSQGASVAAVATAPSPQKLKAGGLGLPVSSSPPGVPNGMPTGLGANGSTNGATNMNAASAPAVGPMTQGPVVGPSTSPNGANGAAHGIGRPQKKAGRPSTNTELYKTELCASYISTGGNCPYGEKCQFAHGTQELKTVDRPPKWRSKPCQNWVKTGTCSYNERCCFRHDMPLALPQ